MTTQGYANQPSRSDREFVTNSKGEKVRNRAFSGKATKNKGNLYAFDMDYMTKPSSEITRDNKIDMLEEDIRDGLDALGQNSNLVVKHNGYSWDAGEYALHYAENEVDGIEQDPDDTIVVDYGTGNDYMDEANEETLDLYDGVTVDKRLKQVSMPVSEWVDRWKNDGDMEVFEQIEGTHTDSPVMNESAYDRLLGDKAEEALDDANLDRIADEIVDDRMDDWEYSNPDHADEESDEKRDELERELGDIIESNEFRNAMVNEIRDEYDGNGDMVADADRLREAIMER